VAQNKAEHLIFIHYTVYITPMQKANVPYQQTILIVLWLAKNFSPRLLCIAVIKVIRFQNSD